MDKISGHTLSEKINLLSNLARENYSLPEAQTRNSVIHKQKVLKIKYIFFTNEIKIIFGSVRAGAKGHRGSLIYIPGHLLIKYNTSIYTCIYRQINSNCRS